jgi:hypothetical protein
VAFPNPMGNHVGQFPGAQKKQRKKKEDLDRQKDV